MASPPLGRYEQFRSKDIDDMRRVVGDVLKPHRLEPLRRDARLNAWIHSLRLRDISAHRLGYGTEVLIDLGRLETFFAVLIPLSGRAVVRCGAELVRSAGHLAAVASPPDALSMRWSADSSQLVVRIERTALEARLSDMLGSSLRRPLRFLPAMDVGSGYGGSLRRCFELLIGEFDRPGGLVEHPVVAREFEWSLLTALLVTQQHNHSDELGTQHHYAPSRAVSIAIELMERHPKWAHTTTSLARESGVTERALQLGFRRHLDMTPMEYLRDVRLRRVRDRLRAAQPDAVTVAEVASEWGFLHLGHFAARYHQRFGEKPSETLRR